MPETDRDWIGVDLDRTLAKRVSGDPISQIGDRIEPMCDRVRSWLRAGRRVKIFTARVNPMHEDLEAQREMIRHWTRINLGQELEATCMKDRFMTALWDDLAIRVDENTGHVCVGCREVPL